MADAKAQPAAQVRAYFASLPPAARGELKTLRQIIHAAAPGATEIISYGIVGVKLDGKSLLWYGAWKRHCSIYPITPGVSRALGSQIGKYKAAKGTIQFPLEDPIPAALVKRIVKARVAELRSPRR